MAWLGCAKDPVETTIIRVQALELLRLGLGIGPPGSTHPTCPLLWGVAWLVGGSPWGSWLGSGCPGMGPASGVY